MRYAGGLGTRGPGARGARGTAAAAFALLVLAVPACSSDEPDVPAFSGGPSPGGTSGASTGGSATDGASGSLADGEGVVVEAQRPAPTDPGYGAVYEAYVAFWTEDAAVLADPTRSLDALTALLGDPQLTRTTEFIDGQRALGRSSVGVISVAPVVSVQDGSIAVVDDCLDDSALSSVDEQGEPVPDSAGSRQPVEVTLQATGPDGGWVVTNLGPGDATSCA